VRDALLLLPPQVLALCALAVSLAFGAWAVYNARRAYRLSRRIAEIQGTLQAPNLEVSLFDRPIPDQMIVAAPLSGQEILELPLRFAFRNKGGKSAKDVLVQFSLPKALFFGGHEHAAMSVSVDLKGFDAKVLKSSGHVQRLHFEATSLQPHLGMVIPLPCSLCRQTSGDVDVPLTLADGAELVANVHYEFAFRVDIVVLQADQRPFATALSLLVLDTSTTSLDDHLAARYRRLKSGEPVRSRKARRLLLIELPHDAISPHAHLQGVKCTDLSKARGRTGVLFDNAIFLLEAPGPGLK
jgi:hypothetical protein